MELDRNFYIRLESLYKLFGAVRSKKSGHILDTDRISAAFLYLLRIVYIVIGCEDLAESIGDRYLCMSAFLFGCLNGCLKVSYVVKRIEYTDYIYSVRYGLLNEVFKDIISVVTVSEHILSSEKHLELCIRHLAS